MLVTLPETVLKAMLAMGDGAGPLYGWRRDGGDVWQVRGLAPSDGEPLGRWSHADAGPAAAAPGALALSISPDEAAPVAAHLGGEHGQTSVACHVVRHHADYSARLRGLFESDRLGRARVAIIGLGSGGSLVATQLARCGIGALHLVDHDRLAVQNIARHACGLDDVGRYKTLAVADLLRGISPLVSVRTWEADILAEPAALEAAIADCDLVIGATDSEQTKLAINRIAWAYGLPAVYGAAYNRAFGGDVFRATPPDGACYECLHATVGDMFEPPPTAAADFSPGYADPSRMADLIAEPGLVIDVTMIATLLTRAAIASLLRDSGSLADLPGNWLLFGNRPDWIFQRHLESIFLEIERRPDCPVCNYEGYTRLHLNMSPEAARAAAARILADAENPDHAGLP